jgi:Bacteriophage tail sheath protein
MVAYSRPGVYVNQTQAPIATNSGTIPGQPVACFVANYNAGPTVPTFVTSWQQFNTQFGGFGTGSTSYLTYAVYQYFANGGTGCYVLRCPNSDATQASLTTANVNGSNLPAPATPVTTPTTGTGSLAAGTYKVEVTYVDAAGETTASGSTTAVLASTGEIVVTSPAAQAGATGWYVYFTAAGGSTYFRQQTVGSPTAIGTNFTLAATPSLTGANPPVTNTTGTAAFTVTAFNPGAFGNSIFVYITPTSGTATTTFNLTVYLGGTNPSNLVESWNGVSINPAATRYAPSLINSTNTGSQYIRLSNLPTTYVSGTSDPQAYTAPIALNTAAGPSQPAVISSVSGTDGTTPMNLFNVLSGTSVPSVAWNQGTLASLNSQMLVVNVPDVQNSGTSGAYNFTLANELVAWAAGLGSVFIVLDGPFGGGNLSSSGVAALYTNLTQGGGGNIVNSSSYVAIYGPWLSIQDPASTSAAATRWVPPCGAILGLWAQNDTIKGVQQTPAGIGATVVASQLEAYFSPTDLANLESAQVNPVKLVPGVGFCVFGALTTAASYPSRYINISRVLQKIAHDVVYLTNFAIFQNNTPQLWQAITTVLTNYLLQQMQSKLLYGATQNQAFVVICDETVNTPATIQAGIVNASVAVAVASPAEFVVINLSQMVSGATTTISS